MNFVVVPSGVIPAAGAAPTDPGFNVPREYGEWVKIPKYSLRKLAGR